jgi:hypothetical protein
MESLSTLDKQMQSRRHPRGFPKLVVAAVFFLGLVIVGLVAFLA